MRHYLNPHQTARFLRSTLFVCMASMLSSTTVFAKETVDGVQVGKMSSVRGLVSEDSIERQAFQEYSQLKQQAAQQHALGPESHPDVQRIHHIAQRLIPFTTKWNPRAAQWQWEANLIGSREVNAFCMPGGKIAFYSGIINNLKLTDDEIAIVMGHEMTHALREHGRERAAKTRLANGAVIMAQLFGAGAITQMVIGQGAQMSLLKFSRDDEKEADEVGLDLAARAGFDPRAGVSLWQKMGMLNKNSPPQWMSTHPSDKNRITDIAKHLKDVLPLYAKATNQDVRNLPPYRPNVQGIEEIR